MSDASFVSYAQHGEDVVLHRALRRVAEPFYVDVGAADPSDLSVTRALYERGWHGIDVEAMPDFAAALRAARPRDTVVETAAGAQNGSITFYATAGTGLSTTVEAEAQSARGHGFAVEEITVGVRTLDDILGEHVAPGREIHVLKIDVEGGEAAVLGGLDLTRWRPWVVVVEATRPLSTVRTDDEWRHLLTDAGYTVTMFDGLNLWLVADEHLDLAPALAYPACPLDDYVRAGAATVEVASARSLAEPAFAVAQARFATTGARGQQVAAERRLAAAEGRVRSLERDLTRTRASLTAVRSSPWWRATRIPRSVVGRLKGVRRRLRSRGAVAAAPAVAAATPAAVTAAPTATLSLDDAILRRLRSLLEAEGDPVVPDDLEGMRAHLATKLVGTEAAMWAWGLYVAWTGVYADDVTVENLLGRLDLEGPEAMLEMLDAAALAVPEVHWPRTAPLVVTRRIAVDISHTASNDIHTGIQRVVRETVPRWAAQHDIELIVFDAKVRTFRPTTALEQDRVLAWPPSQVLVDAAPEPSRTVILPWRTQVVVPEVPAVLPRADRLRGLAVHSGMPVTFLCYDLIPVTRGESTHDQLPSGFSRYLSVVKYSTRLTAISASVAREFEGFGEMLVGQGLPPLSVRTHLLPAAGEPVAADRLAAYEDEILGATRLPLVLSVASIEPRKNHMRTLEAAERLWLEGHSFQLLFIAGAHWKNTAFDDVVDRLQRRGRPVRVLSRVDDELLWAAYQLARCSVFVSLVEGYGLPAAESLSLGAPVVITGYGSMAEIAAGGGTIMVDPRDPDSIAAALRTMVTDDEAYAELRRAALARPVTTWDEYAAATWSWLVDGI